jgi:large subunit ribosomal protein L22
MSPEREIDETKGANPPEKVGEEAKEAKKAAAKPRRRTRKKAEEPKAEAAATKPKPRRRTTRKKAEEPKAEEPKAEEKPAEVEEKPEEQAEEATKAPAPTPKAQRPTPTGPVAVRARARYVRTSARKARLVCDHIRGKTVPEARAILDFTPRAAARDWTKVLDSAVANAEANHELIGDELKITEAYADEGPTLKRYRPRAMGRATRIRKRTSHLTITLTPVMSAAKERS